MTEQFDFEVYTTEMYRQVVAEADPDEGIGRQEAMELATSKVLAAIDRGDIKPDLTDTVKRALLSADERQGKRADKLIKTLTTGQTSLDIADDLDTVVTLGGGRRKLWRHCDERDLTAMDDLRYENFRAQGEAYNLWRDHFVRAREAVRSHHTVEGVVRAGAFDVEADES